jgi:broad specificity phosphatase PhoE
MSSKIFVFRHTQSLDNEFALFSGGRNIGLSKKGYTEAEKLSEHLKNERIDIAYTSDLIRSMDTMSIVLKHHPEVFLCVDQRIRERSYGILEGQSKKKWAKYAFPIFKIFHRSYRFPPPGGESLIMVQKRVKSFTMDLTQYIKGKSINIAICAHSGSIRGIREYFENIPEQDFNKIETAEGELFEYTV